MMHSKTALYDEVRKTMIVIDQQIDAIVDHYESQPWINLLQERVEPRNPYIQMDKNGRFVLTDLLAAKAQCISAMASLRVSMEG